jgi:hypothetical protein
MVQLWKKKKKEKAILQSLSVLILVSIHCVYVEPTLCVLLRIMLAGRSLNRHLHKFCCQSLYLPPPSKLYMFYFGMIKCVADKKRCELQELTSTMK